MKTKHKRKAVLALLFLSVLILVFASLFIGNFKISFSEFFEFIKGKLSGTQYSANIEAVLVNIRFKRIIAALVVGAALSVSGLVYQTVFSNNMVSPDLLGVSSSAACGAAMAIVLGFSPNVSFFSSFVFSVLAVILTGFLSKLLKGKNNLLLAGIIVAGFAKSGLGLLKYVADSENGELESIVYWELGSLAKVTWEQMLIAIPITVLIIAVLFLMRRRISCLIFGQSSSLLGIYTSIERIIAIALASLLVSLCTAMCGVISWVSLIVPIAACELTRSGDIADNILVSSLLGAFFLLASDNVARAATTSEIPLSILTGTAGLIIFCVAVFSRREKRKL